MKCTGVWSIRTFPPFFFTLIKVTQDKNFKHSFLRSLYSSLSYICERFAPSSSHHFFPHLTDNFAVYFKTSWTIDISFLTPQKWFLSLPRQKRRSGDEALDYILTKTQNSFMIENWAYLKQYCCRKKKSSHGMSSSPCLTTWKSETVWSSVDWCNLYRLFGRKEEAAR